MLGHVRTCVRSAVVGRYGMATRPLSLLTDGLTTVELQNAFGKFPCVKLRGMPFNVTLHDIDDFLNGLRPIDIIIPKENPSGSVALLFSNARDADACMELDRKPIGSRYVDAIRIHRAEYYLMALESLCRDYGAEPDGVEAEMKGAPEGSILKMAGMPYEATYVDIQRFFPGYDLDFTNIVIEARSDGKPTGNAYVRFESPDDATKALKHDKKYMGNRFIRLQVAKTADAVECHSIPR